MHDAQDGARQANQGQDVAQARTLHVHNKLQLPQVQQREHHNGLQNQDCNDACNRAPVLIAV